MIITIMVLYALFSFLPEILHTIYVHLKLRIQLITVPGRITIPFVGSVFASLVYSKDEMFRLISLESLRHSKGIFVLWIGLQAIVCVRKPHQVEIILKDHTLITKGRSYDYLNDWLGKGLLTSTGDLWHRHRRLLTPAFHFGVLDQFAETIFDKVQMLNDSIGSLYDQDPNRLINIFPMATKFTLDASCKTVMGLDLEVQKNHENEYNEALHTFVELSTQRFFCFWFWSDYIYNKSKTGKRYWHSVKTMHNFTRKLIDEKIKLRREKRVVKNSDTKNEEEKGPKKIRPFLDLVIDLSEADENTLTSEEIREQVDTFMFASHDTTGISISYLLFCLGNTPDVQDKAYDEIRRIIPNDDKVPSKQQLMQLKYIDRVIKEALRLFPSAPFVMRYLTRDVDIDGYRIPKGANLKIMIMQMHWDPDIYPEPSKFDPDRFLPENNDKRHPFAYIPFSAGPRNCIGQKFALLLLKISLVAILKQWIVHSEVTIDVMKYSSNFMLSPPNNILNLRFERRR